MNQPASKFSLSARWFHWISAIVIFWAMVSGLTVSSFELPETIEHAIGEFNISITFLFIPVFIARIAYRLWRGVPNHPLLDKTQLRIAEVSHWFIYGVITLVLVSGVLMMNKSFSVFHLFTVPPVITDKQIAHNFSVLHQYASRLLAICILLHLLAVVKHHLSGINVMHRMI